MSLYPGTLVLSVDKHSKTSALHRLGGENVNQTYKAGLFRDQTG